MSEIGGKYKQIMKDLEKNIQDPQELEFVKEKFSDLSLLFIDIIDRLTKLTDARIKQIEDQQSDINNRVKNIQAIVDNIENDIYEDDENYEFEIVCPYCNYEFTTDIEDEDKSEIECPECHNTIELDWNSDDDYEGCAGNCSSCGSNCNVAEDEEKYHMKNSEPIEDDEELKDQKNHPEDDDM